MALNYDEIALADAFKRDPLMDVSLSNLIVKERYKVLKLWAETSRTNIFTAYDLKEQKPVLAHIVKNHLFRQGEELQKWIKSVKSMRRLKEPGWCFELLDLDIWKKKLVCVTAPFDGLTLSHILSSERELPLNFVLKILSNVAGLLSKAATLGYPSRSITREDLFVNPEGEIRLLRFTPSRMEGLSPEQVRDVTPDLYFLSCLIYELFCYEIPFTQSRRHIDLERAHFMAKLKTRKNQSQKDLFGPIVDLFVMCSGKDSDNRIDTMEVLIQKLQKLWQESLRLHNAAEMKTEREQLNSAFDVVYALRGESSPIPPTATENAYSRVWQKNQIPSEADTEFVFRIIAVLIIVLSFCYKFFQGGS
ncbi:MAG: hypothetical protein H3C47_02325 [Candidatus Cloacimonetes bacterium]|nr:hypothetical protein [Candidatus Cloacimonadota bacterium]